MLVKKKIVLGLFLFITMSASLQHHTSFAGSLSKVSTDTRDSKAELFESYVQRLYNSIQYDKSRPDFDVFRKAYIGYLNLKAENKLSNKSILSVIDFRLSSKNDRLWIIDLNKKEIIHSSVVSHGRNTGNEFAKNFSNVNESNMSSYGFYVTGITYTGKHGLSLYLDGMDAGYNCNARNRAIVMHSAEYANPEIIKTTGRLGRSLGCPAIPEANHKEIISTVANKTCLFIYYPDAEYEKKSKFLSFENALTQFSFENAIPSTATAAASL